MLISFHSIERVIRTEYQHLTKLEPKSIHLWGITLDRSPQCLARCRNGWLTRSGNVPLALFEKETGITMCWLTESSEPCLADIWVAALNG